MESNMELQAVDDDRDVFQCNICMGHPRNSVLTSCGHLFCWSCLHGWLQHQEKPCPVCKLTVRDRGIIPVYGCQPRGSSSRVEAGSLLPRRPSAPSMEARQSSGSSDPTTDTPLASYFYAAPRRPASMRDLRMDSLRSRAQADFQAIRASHPPSSARWIAEASDEFARAFDPFGGVLEPRGEEPSNNLHVFVFRVLVPQGEVFPGINDFRSSWLPYYEVQNPQLETYEHYNDFLEAWARHFRTAWDRAGRPARLFYSNMIEAPVESRLPRAPGGSEAGSNSWAIHEDLESGSESEVEEIGAMEFKRAQLERRA